MRSDFGPDMRVHWKGCGILCQPPGPKNGDSIGIGFWQWLPQWSSVSETALDPEIPPRRTHLQRILNSLPQDFYSKPHPTAKGEEGKEKAHVCVPEVPRL